MRGKYILEKKIGGGSFGEVYLGKLNVAIKRIPKKLVKEENLYQDIEREKNLLIKCQSENIVKLIELIETKDNYDFILEQCDTDLKKVLNNKKEGFTIPEIRKIMNQLNKAFKLMNLNNIIHRDIKLENILVSYINEDKSDYIIKLGDFGFSREIFSDIYDSFCGTPETMAPEMVDQQHYNNKIDLWSIGIIMYELFFKKFPKFDDNYNIINDLPNDDNFKDLILKLLKRDPDERLSWKDYFNHPFFLDIKHINIAVMGKKQIGKTTLIESILNEDKINIKNKENYKIYESKKKRIRFFEMNGFDDNNYKFENCFDDLNTLINLKLESKELDNHIHMIYYCLQEDMFNSKESKDLNYLKEYYCNDKIPICIIHTYTLNKHAVFNFFHKIIGKNENNIITCKLLAKEIEIKNEEGEVEDVFVSFGIDYLLKKTLDKLKKLCEDDKNNQNYLSFQKDKKKTQEGLISIIEQIKSLIIQ